MSRAPVRTWKARRPPTRASWYPAAGLGTDLAPWLVFGLGAGRHADRLVVSWPDGSSLAIDDPPLNRPIRIQ